MVSYGQHAARISPVNMPDPIQKRFGYGQLRPACSQNQPGKHAGSDPEAFWLWSVMASMQPESARIVHNARFDFLHPFQFHFSKEGMDHIVQNRPGSDLDGLVRV